jgi:hypothetical protein
MDELQGHAFEVHNQVCKRFSSCYKLRLVHIRTVQIEIMEE